MISTPRRRVEDCACITAHPDLLRPVLERHSLLLHGPDTRDTPTADLAVTWPNGSRSTVHPRLTHTDQTNGQRWWFICPACDRRCRCLYSPSPSTQFACRQCHRLVYRSQYDKTPSRLFFRMWRFLEESNEIDDAIEKWKAGKKAREENRAAWNDRVRVAD